MNSLLSRIAQTPGQCGGRPCIRGMRIRVSDILEMLVENVITSEILEDFPDPEIADERSRTYRRLGLVKFSPDRYPLLSSKP